MAGEAVIVFNDSYGFCVCDQMETTPDHCRLYVDKSRREDSGSYTITAANQYGKDSANIEVSTSIYIYELRLIMMV